MQPIRTFSVGFAEPDANELAYARLAARSVGRRAPRGRRSTAGSSSSALPQLVWHEDEPIAFPSSVPLYFVSRLAARARQGRAHGRGRRRAVPRLQPLPRHGLERSDSAAPYRAMVPRALREAIRRLTPRLPPRMRRYARRSFLALEPGAARPLLRELRGVPAGACSASCSADARLLDGGDPVRRRAPLLRGGAGRHARADEPRRSADLPGRAADEAGPDEHGGVRSRAACRSSITSSSSTSRRCRARLKLSRGYGPRRCCETALAGLVPAGDSHAAQDGVPRAGRRGGCAACTRPLVDDFVSSERVLSGAGSSAEPRVADGSRSEHRRARRSTATGCGCS